MCPRQDRLLLYCLDQALCSCVPLARQPLNREINCPFFLPAERHTHSHSHSSHSHDAVDPDCSVCQEEEKAKAKAGALEGAALSSAGHGHSHGHSEHAHQGQEYDPDCAACNEEGEGHGHVRIEGIGYRVEDGEKLAGRGEGRG